MKCERCGIEHYGRYGSGRFCSEKCAKSRKGSISPEEDRNRIEKVKQYYLSRDKEILESGGEVSIDRLRIYVYSHLEKRCQRCGNTHWMDREIPLEIHHKNGKNNTLDNIELLCLNCHGLTENYKHKGVGVSSEERSEIHRLARLKTLSEGRGRRKVIKPKKEKRFSVKTKSNIKK